MNDAIATMLAPNLGLLPVSVSLVELLSQELEELVCILLLCSDEVLEGFLLRNPKAGQNVGGGVTIGILECVEILEHIVHGTAETMGHITVAALVPIAQVKVA